MPFAIEAVDLKKRFRKAGYKNVFPWKRESVLALNGVSFEVREGELFGILGPNGAGKTTLTKILGTLILPDSGEAYINGFDIYRRQKKIKRFIGYVTSEERSFYWRLTGRQNLAFFATLYDLSNSEANQRINFLIDLLALSTEVDKPFMSYSTGFKQRLSIARSLLCNPQILLLDEPTRSLDPLAKLRLQQFVKRKLIGEQKKTVFLATHDLSEAEYLCDRIAFLSEGKIVASGTIDEIKKRLEGKINFHIKLKTERNDLVNELRKIDGVSEIKIISHLKNTINLGVTLNGEEVISDVLAKLAQKQVMTLACTPKRLSLKDIFEQVICG